MVNIGDVFAIIATLIGLGVTSWALMVCCALLFPDKVSHARVSSGKYARANIGLGLVLLIPGIAGFVMLSAGPPLLKVVGWVILLSILSVGAIGAAGLAYLASDTLRKMAPDLSEYPAFVRGSAFLVTASMLPILGWFVFGPLVLLASLGGGLRAVTRRITVPPPVALENLA
jgi:hypothetical protein